MANDFEGDVEDFAIVIPVPTMIEREQINVGDRAIIQHLDAYTAPRLVEYWEADPCAPEPPMPPMVQFAAAMPDDAPETEGESGATLDDPPNMVSARPPLAFSS